MKQARIDLIAFYNSLPNWAQSEFQLLLQRVNHGEIDGGELTTAIQELINRAEHAGDRAGSTYLH